MTGTLLPAALAGAAELQATSNVSSAVWDLVIAVFVCVVAGSVAYLCTFAVRLWTGLWRGFAAAPLAVLAVWMGIIFFAMFSGQTRSLWTVEVLFWAMATTVYLVVLFTARRTFEKAEAEGKKGRK